MWSRSDSAENATQAKKLIMKNISIVSLLLLMLCPLSYARETNAKLKQNRTVTKNLIATDSSTKATANNIISSSIGISFIKTYEKDISSNIYLSKRKRFLPKKELIKTGIKEGWSGHTANLHDIKMIATIDQQDDKKFFIITTEVYGSPEDFLGQNVLDNEKDLLKNILIQQYLDQDNKQGNPQAKSFLIDQHTKVTLRPQFLIVSLRKGMFSNTIDSYSTTRKGMIFVTIFSEKEFDQLIKHCFPKKSQSNNSSLRPIVATAAFTLGACSGIGIIAAACYMGSSKNQSILQRIGQYD